MLNSNNMIKPGRKSIVFILFFKHVAQFCNGLILSPFGLFQNRNSIIKISFCILVKFILSFLKMEELSLRILENKKENDPQPMVLGGESPFLFLIIQKLEPIPPALIPATSTKWTRPPSL